MKVEIDIPEGDIVMALQTIMSVYPNSNENGFNMICIKSPNTNDGDLSDDDSLTFEFFDKETNQRFTLIKESLIVAFSRLFETGWSESYDTPRTDDLESWAEDFDDEQTDKFVQIACYGEIKYNE